MLSGRTVSSVATCGPTFSALRRETKACEKDLHEREKVTVDREFWKDFNLPDPFLDFVQDWVASS